MKTRHPFAIGVLLAGMSLASCGSPATPNSPSPSSSQPSATPTITADIPPADEPTPPSSAETPTCKTLITPGTVEALEAEGWTFKQRDFVIGDIAVEDGLECLWADYSTASDHGQMYAWGLLSADRARAAQTGLVNDGWLRSTEGETTYITEDPAYAIATDGDGFGMTYEFGDGWVKFADTRQGLLLIEWGD